jgi:hypothetical protein
MFVEIEQTADFQTEDISENGSSLSVNVVAILIQEAGLIPFIKMIMAVKSATVMSLEDIEYMIAKQSKK